MQVAVVTLATVLTAADGHKVTAEPPLNTYVKATPPPGFVAPRTLGVTVAVKVTGWLTTDGAGVETTAVVVAVPTTACDTLPVDAWKLLSPEYTALSVYAPCAGKV